MRARFRAASVLVVSALVLAGCGGTGGGGTGGTGGSTAGARSEFPMTVENCGRQVTFDKRPERVLVIDPEAATLLTAAGDGNKIRWYAGYTVGIPLGDAEGPVRAAQHLTDKSSDLTLETIIGARPDVVIGYGAKLIPGLQAAGIQMLIVSAYCEDEGFIPHPGNLRRSR